MAAINKLNLINQSIETLAKAERITKKELSFLSRSLLEYVMIDAGVNDNDKQRDLGDIDSINRTLSVLTPMNKKTAVLFFVNFLPFSFDEDKCTFGKMNKKKKDESIKDITTFLENENNDIWTWAEANIKVEKKEIDYAKLIQTTIAKAMDEDKGGLSPLEVMNAVLNSDGITADMLLGLLDTPKKAEL